jgi:hypothetical protein
MFLCRFLRRTSPGRSLHGDVVYHGFPWRPSLPGSANARPPIRFTMRCTMQWREELETAPSGMIKDFSGSSYISRAQRDQQRQIDRQGRRRRAWLWATCSARAIPPEAMIVTSSRIGLPQEFRVNIPDNIFDITVNRSGRAFDTTTASNQPRYELPPRHSGQVH